jgi:hypothetical protein
LIVLEISQTIFAAFSRSHRQKWLPLICNEVVSALCGPAGSALGVSTSCKDEAAIGAIVQAAEAHGLDGNKDIIAYALLTNCAPECLPIETRAFVLAALHDDTLD